MFLIQLKSNLFLFIFYMYPVQGHCIHYKMTGSPSCTYAHYIIMYTVNQPPQSRSPSTPHFFTSTKDISLHR